MSASGGLAVVGLLQSLHRFTAVGDDVIIGLRPALDELGEGLLVWLTIVVGGRPAAARRLIADWSYYK